MVEEKHFKRDSIINLFGYGFYMGCQWLVNILVVRLSGYSDAGILALAISVTSLFYVLSHFNIRTFQVSDYQNLFTSQEYTGQRIVNCAAAFVLCVIYSLILGYGGEKLICIVVYMGFKLTEAFLDVLHGIIQKSWRLDLIGYSFALRGIVSISLFAGGLLFFHNLIIAVSMMFIGSLLLLFIFEIPISNRYSSVKPKIDFKRLTSLYKSSVWMVIFYFVFNILTILPRTVLEATHGTDVLGIFTSVAAPVFLLQISSQIILMPIINVLTKHVENRDRKSFLKALLIGFIGISVICALIFVAAVFLGDWALILVYGESIAPYTGYFLPLIVSTYFLVLSSLATTALTVLRAMKKMVLSAVLSMIPCMISSFALIPDYGLDGITAVMVISFASMALISFIMLIPAIMKYFKGEKNYDNC